MSTFIDTNSVSDSNDGMDSTIVDYNNLSREEKEELELEKEELEKGKHRIYRRVSKSLSDGSTVYYIKKIVVYSTRSNPGARIRDPVCGVLSSEDKVGSIMEYNYFKVKMADYFTNDREGLTLYYDSPEGYERHQCTRVSTNIKNAWHNRRTELIGVEIPRYDAPKYVVIK